MVTRLSKIPGIRSRNAHPCVIRKGAPPDKVLILLGQDIEAVLAEYLDLFKHSLSPVFRYSYAQEVAHIADEDALAFSLYQRVSYFATKATFVIRDRLYITQPLFPKAGYEGFQHIFASLLSIIASIIAM
jgi:hypothetical protein